MKKLMSTCIKYILLKRKIYLSDFKTASKISLHAKFGENIQILKDVHIGKEVQIGDYSYINEGTRIFDGIIGRFCSIGYDCLIGPPEHPTNQIITHPIAYDKDYPFFKHNNQTGYKQPKAPIIEDNVWIGARSIILKGVIIGEGSIIGANSVVTKDVLPYSIVGGIPAKRIKTRESSFRLMELTTKQILEKISKGELKET